jgi:hypothetical protein
MLRMLTNPRFWMLTFVVAWLAMITVLIAMGADVTPDNATGR